MSLYELDYFAARVDSRRTVMQLQELWRIHERLTAPPETVLDIGCGTGEFLTMFSGALLYGMETSEYATKIAQSRGVSFDLPRAGRWADLVIIRGVLQHVPNPRATLHLAHHYLRNGGLLAILATPNKDSLVYRRTGTLPCLVPELNHWIPTPRTLTRVLEDIGFEPPAFHFPYWRTPYANPWRDALQLLLGRPAPFPKNMLECFARR